MYATFANMSALEIAPVLPSTVINIDYLFYCCHNLLEAPPVIPDSVVNMGGTFSACNYLKTAPVIPENVKILYAELTGASCFEACYSLTGDLIINANPTNYKYCLKDVATNPGCSLKLSGKSTMLNQILSTAQKYNNSNYTYEANPNVTLK